MITQRGFRLSEESPSGAGFIPNQPGVRPAEVMRLHVVPVFPLIQLRVRQGVCLGVIHEAFLSVNMY